MKWLLIALLFASAPALGQTQKCFSVMEPVTFCNGTSGASRTMSFESFQAQSGSPTPAYIVSAWMMNQADSNATPVGAGGVWVLAHDPGGGWSSKCGYPTTQCSLASSVKNLARLEIKKGFPLASQTEYVNPPSAFRPGDVLMIDMPCVGNFYAQMVWSMCYLANTVAVP